MSLPISGFTAVPNPQMLAFMAAQSFVMMMQAGEGWQYGKRKQSAMTNEEFNKQTPLSIMERQMSELKTAIPTIEKSMNAMTPMIRTIVIQYGDFLAEIIKATPDILKAAQGGQTLPGNISIVGQEFAEIAKLLAAKVTNFNILPAAHADSSHAHAQDPFTQGATQGPGTFNTPTNTFQNIQDTQKQITSGKLQTPEQLAEINRQKLLALKTQPSADALRRKAIADSGLSPLAFNARETFRKNIDKQQAIVTQMSSPATIKANTARGVLNPALVRNIETAVKKLSALRIKYQQVYGEHY